MKPVKDEPKIPVELRPDQLADIIDAVLAFADDCANDREILQSMPRVDRDSNMERKTEAATTMKLKAKDDKNDG